MLFRALNIDETTGSVKIAENVEMCNKWTLFDEKRHNTARVILVADGCSIDGVFKAALGCDAIVLSTAFTDEMARTIAGAVRLIKRFAKSASASC